MLRQQNPAFLAGFSIACPQGFSPLADAVCAEKPPLHALRTVDLRHIAENPAHRSKLRSIPLFRRALRAPYKPLPLRQQNPTFTAGFSIACPQVFSSVADTPYTPKVLRNFGCNTESSYILVLIIAYLQNFRTSDTTPHKSAVPQRFLLPLALNDITL